MFQPTNLKPTNPKLSRYRFVPAISSMLIISMLALSGCFSFMVPTPASEAGEAASDTGAEDVASAGGGDSNDSDSDSGSEAAMDAPVEQEAAPAVTEAEFLAVSADAASDEAGRSEAAAEEVSVASVQQAMPASAPAKTSTQNSSAQTSNAQTSIVAATQMPMPTASPAPTTFAQQATNSLPEPTRASPETMFFQDYGVNPFVNTADDNLSTFAMDVDTGSYTIMRNYVNDGLLPPQEAVRVEEYVNYFDYGYTTPDQGEVFAIQIDAAQAPFADIVDVANESQDVDVRTIRVGIQGYEISAAERKDVALTFVVDVSGSMDQENRMTLAKRALNMLVEELRPTDSVAIVAYGDSAYSILRPTAASDMNTIIEAIYTLNPGGSTNAEAGLTLGYESAWSNFNPQVNNRLILISDGVANVGETTPGSIWHQVEQYAERGITLTSIGVGMGNYNDVLLEQLANMGDGTYAYVDTIDEARRIFVDELTGTLQTIAKDAKVQVEFNQDLVAAYRLIGYENRDVADSDFRNDTVDAGEIGAGHSVTALYEVVLNGDTASQAEDAQTTGRNLLTVSLRWLNPETGEPTEIAESLAVNDATISFADAAPDFQLAVVVAEFAEILRASHWTADEALSVNLADEIYRIGSLMADDEKVDEFVRLIEQVERIGRGG